MSHEQNTFDGSKDPFGLNWELRQVLSSAALPERVDDPDCVEAPAVAALYHLAEVLGECRLFKVDIDPSLNGTLSLNMALAVERAAIGEAKAILQGFNTVRSDGARDSDAIDPWDIEHAESAIDLTERVLSLVAVQEAITEAYYASVGEGRESVDRMRDAIDQYLGVREELDATMSEHMEVLLPVRRTNLLSNWFAMLRDDYQLLAERWWWCDEDRWREAELRAVSRLAAVEAPGGSAAPAKIEKEGLGEQRDALARFGDAVWQLATPHSQAREFSLAAHSDDVPAVTLQHAFWRTSTLTMPDGSLLEVTIQLNSRWQAEVFLAGAARAIDNVSAMNLGGHGLTKGAVFHWITQLDPTTDEEVQGILLSLPLVIRLSDDSEYTIRQEDRQ